MLISINPAAGVKGPKVMKRPIVPISGDEYDAILEATPDRYQALVALGAGSGMRPGERLGLAETEVRMLRREVEVVQQLLRPEPKSKLPLRIEPPKSEVGYRTIPLADETLEILAWHMGEFRRGPKNAIFTRPDGDWMRHQNWRAKWARIVRDAGIDRARFHATAMETLDTYGHMWPDDPEISRAAIAKALAR
jgi:integrase